MKAPYFGKIELNSSQIEFHNTMNAELLLLCKKLPIPLQNPAAIFLLQYNPGKDLLFDFMSLFYPPSYTILYWTIHYSQTTNQNISKYALRAMAMALFLHLLDDHITDGDIRANHLHLQIRTVAWNTFMESCESLAEQTSNGKETIQEYIDEYFANIYNPPEIRTLEDYENLFPKQIATWRLVVNLLAKVLSTEETAIVLDKIYSSFGIAWRLLDDLQDWEKDCTEKQKTAVYYTIPKDKRSLWENGNKEQILELKDVFEKELICKIKSELEKSKNLSEGLQWKHFSTEFESLQKTL
jgi:hypothetical protein